MMKTKILLNINNKQIIWDGDNNTMLSFLDDRPEYLQSNRIIVLNGYVIPKEKIDNTILKDGDIITILPVVSGG